MHKQTQLVQMVWLVKLGHMVKVGKTYKLIKLAQYIGQNGQMR